MKADIFHTEFVPQDQDQPLEMETAWPISVPEVDRIYQDQRAYGLREICRRFNLNPEQVTLDSTFINPTLDGPRFEVTWRQWGEARGSLPSPQTERT